MKKPFSQFIKTAKVGQYFFSVETGLKYRLTAIEKEISFAIELNQRDNGHDNEEVQLFNNDKDSTIF